MPMIGNKEIGCQVLAISSRQKVGEQIFHLLLASSTLEGEKPEPILTQFARHAAAEHTF